MGLKGKLSVHWEGMEGVTEVAPPQGVTAVSDVLSFLYCCSRERGFVA